ncbi:hypothetical protein ACRAQ7_06900 [Erythrobacter sp. W53]|uniref:hypothetical protein n=1 Tax=Erythrobacter sp. W53 TaxID=3425947 RepID=UPI003D769E46
MAISAHMSDEETPNFADERPDFPYHAIWAGYGNAKVTLREIKEQRELYQSLENWAAGNIPDLPGIEIERVEELLLDHGIEESAAFDFWLICSFYQRPKQLKALGFDPARSRDVLSQAANTAQRLRRTIGKLSPLLLAALHYKRAGVAGVSKHEGLPLHQLQEELNDFTLVAIDAARELGRPEGRPTSHHRDSMLRLFIELLEEHGLGDLTISSGTKDNPQPHLKGRAGRCLVDLVNLVEPTWSEEWLAPKVKPVRTKLRRAKSRSKTQQS